MYLVFAVPDDAPNLPEQLGTKEKFWFEKEGAPYLFKLGRQNAGDDWSEKVACELCELLGVPHAKYELATYKGQRGVVSRNFVPPGGRLVHGNELLAKIVDRYPVRQFFGVKEHTLTRVLAVLRRRRVLAIPIGSEPLKGVRSAIDFFVGYLMLDAWIANQDRHHENWGLVVDSQMTVHLAPSYDHASSLGANETDENREDRLNTKDASRSIEHYVARAKSAFYTSVPAKRTMSTVGAFQKAATVRPEAGRAWLKRLEQLRWRDVVAIFEQIPGNRISPVAVRFACRLLELNRDRLLGMEGELR